MNNYRVHNLNISSEILIPEFQNNKVLFSDKADVTIRLGSVPDNLENPSKTGVCYQLGKKTLLLKIDKTAKYLAENGSNITVEVSSGADDCDISCFLTNATFTGIFLQRGMLPLYGSAVEYNGKCTIICGASGIGKSTMAGELLNRGYKLVADDLCVIDIIKDEIVVYPGAKYIKLQEHALKTKGFDCSEYLPVRKNHDKYLVPVSEEKCAVSSLPLDKIVFISSWNKEEIVLEVIEREDGRFNSSHNSMPRQFIMGMGSGFKQMKLTAKLLSVIPMYIIYRIQKKSMLNEMADLIEKELFKK